MLILLMLALEFILGITAVCLGYINGFWESLFGFAVLAWLGLAIGLLYRAVRFFSTHS